MLDFVIDQDKCIKCGECVSDCPLSVIVMPEDGFPEIGEGKETNCIRCQHCLAVCKPGALSIFGLDPEDSMPLKGEFPTPEQMESLIRGRRSVRRYKPEPVEAEIIENLLDVAANAPTGENKQQLMFSVVDDPAVMDRIRKRSYEAIALADKEGRIPDWLVKFLPRVLAVWETHGVDIVFRHAPHLLVVTGAPGSSTPKEDCMIAMTSFELMASSVGLGTLWDGIAGWVFELLAPEILKDIGIPEDHKYGYSMVFGWPAVRYHRTVQRRAGLVNRVRL